MAQLTIKRHTYNALIISFNPWFINIINEKIKPEKIIRGYIPIQTSISDSSSYFL